MQERSNGIACGALPTIWHSSHQNGCRAHSAHECSPEVSGGELRIFSPLVTLDMLAGRLTNVRRVSVPAGAVVTPAVRDLLGSREVELRFIVSERLTPCNAAAIAAHRVTVGVDETVCQLLPPEWLESLTHPNNCVERLPSGGLAEIVDQLALRVAAAECRGVLVTTQPAAALCLANRWRRVRATGAQEPEIVLRDALAIGANFLIVCPQNRNFFALRQLVQTFLDASPPTCPDAWVSRLG